MSAKSIHHENSHSAASGVMSALAFPAVIAVSIIERLQQRRELNQLLKMPDYQLKDIGLQRHQIQQRATDPLWWRIGG